MIASPSLPPEQQKCVQRCILWSHNNTAEDIKLLFCSAEKSRQLGLISRVALLAYGRGQTEAAGASLLPVFAVNTGRKVVLPLGVDWKQQQQQERQQVLLGKTAVEAGRAQSSLVEAEIIWLP